MTRSGAIPKDQLGDDAGVRSYLTWPLYVRYTVPDGLPKGQPVEALDAAAAEVRRNAGGEASPQLGRVVAQISTGGTHP